MALSRGANMAGSVGTGTSVSLMVIEGDAVTGDDKAAAINATPKNIRRAIIHSPIALQGEHWPAAAQ